MENNYQAPNYQDSLFANLGLTSNNQYLSNQQDQIKLQFTNMQNRHQDRYLQNNQQPQQQDQKQQTNQTYIQKPKKKLIQTTSNINKNKRKNVVKSVRRVGKKGKNNNTNFNKNTKKQQIQIDVQLNEIAQWGEKGTKNNNDDDSFDQSDIREQQIAQNIAEQDRIKKKIQQKVKRYQNPSQKRQQGSSLNSLKNKAQQLKKKKNQQKPQIKQQDSTHNLNKIQNKIQQENQQSQQSQDPWDKINQKTLAKQQNQKIQNQQMTLDVVLLYYKQLNSQQKQIVMQELGKEKNQPQLSFFQKLCSCLKPSKKSHTQTEIQIISISKIKLTNNPKQVFLLKQIWTKLTNKRYQRFGEHWNQIGFQGRDPATDLRSTGILSLIHWNFFILQHQQYANKINNFCQQYGIPLALTHIKVTSLVVSSLRKSLLQGKRWQDYQEWYNALTYYTFNKLMKQGKNIQQIGELVQKTIQYTRKNLSLAKKDYYMDVKRR